MMGYNKMKQIYLDQGITFVASKFSVLSFLCALDAVSEMLFQIIPSSGVKISNNW